MIYECYGAGIPYDKACMIAEIEKESFPEPWSVSSITAGAESGFVSYIVPFECGCAVGFSCVQHILDEGEILRIAVRSSYRSRGLGRDILEGFEQIGIRKNYYENGDTALTMKRIL